jgi:sec-independent protein translocase protein TatB
MFDIGWNELLLIAVVAIVVIGPKDLPRAMRFVGQWTGRAKRVARDFQNQFNEAIREAELEDVKKSVTELGKIDPLADVKREMTKAEGDVRAALDKPKPAEPAAASVAPAAPIEPAPAPDAKT